MIKYTHREFKSTLNKLKFPDSWFWSRYTLNTYSGCAHACIYCDARSQRYYLEDFENEVIIKTKFDTKLDARLTRARTLLPDVIAPGGVNDAYQPIEEKEENMRRTLQVIAKHKYPVIAMTKSKLITRDIDLFKQIAADTWCTVGFSITTIDEGLAGFLEPYASTPNERFEAMKTIKQKGPELQVGTFLIPIIPFLEDNLENLEGIVKQTKEAGGGFVLFSPGLTMRDSQATYFIKKLKESKYNHIVEPLLELYQGQMYPAIEHFNKTNKIMMSLSKKYDIPLRIKRWIPKDYRKWNYKISELILNKEYYDSLEGKPYKNMMWAGLNLNNLNESIIDVYKRGELSKLKNFTRRVIDFVEPYLKVAPELHQKKGLDKFL